MNNALIHPLNGLQAFEERRNQVGPFEHIIFHRIPLSSRSCSSFFFVGEVLMDEKCKNAEFVEFGLERRQKEKRVSIRARKSNPNTQ